MAENAFPEQDYYPSAKAVLRVRFDSFDGPEPPPPPKRQNARKGKGKDEQNAELAVREFTLSTGQTVLRLEGPADAPEEFGGPMFTLEPERDFAVAVMPKTASLGRNGIRTANTLAMELKYEDVPLDPRTIQSCSVELYMGTVTAEDFAAGIGGATRTTGDDGDEGAGEPLHLVPNEFVDDVGRRRSNVRFQGWVDSWEVEFPEDGEPLVYVDCTDNTRLLIDQPAPPKLTVSPDVPIDRAIADYLANFPQFRGFQVLFLPPDPEPGSIPTLGSALSRTAKKEQLGPPPAQGGGGSAQMKVWDYLTDVAGMVGHTIRIQGVTIIVQRARALLREDTGKRFDDPFARTDVDGNPLDRRLFVYGDNIVDMRFSRDFTTFSPQNIEVRSYVGRLKKTLIGRFPQKDKRQSNVRVGGKNDQKFEVVRVQGIEDEQTLRTIAQGVYESRARQEMTVNFTTRNLASFGGGGADPDILDLEAGDSIDIEVNRTPPEGAAPSTITAMEDTLSLRQAAVDRLMGYGYPQELAEKYAQAFVNVGVPTTFRVRKLGFDWDEAEGIDIEIEAVNYLTVRADAELPEGGEPNPTENQGAGPTPTGVP